MKTPSPQAALSDVEVDALTKQIDGTPRNWRIFSKALLNASRNAIIVLDPTGIVIISNQRVQNHLKLFSGSIFSDAMPELWPYVKKVLSRRKNFRDVPLQAGPVSYLAYLSPMLFKNDLIGVLCVLEDRTELDKATYRMRSYQELSRELDAIISSSDDGLWTCDADGTILRINAASERLNKVRARDVVGRNIEDLVEEGYFDESVTIRVLKSHKRENLLQQTRAGRRLMLTGNPVFDSSGKLTLVVVNERDITEIDMLRQELEAQLAKNSWIRHQMLETQIDGLAAEKIVARSDNMIKTLRQAFKVSQVESTVLILGESGTGKGVIANLIHSSSDRAEKPMIIVNCGAIPESLVESELFGYEKGAFTGAAQTGKAGYLDLADGGILFLDEVAELPMASQVKLLKFLEDGILKRVGGTTTKKVDVRIICATNKNLRKMVEKGKFRLDLFYRLNVIPITVPPLRERVNCKLPLIKNFIDHFSTKTKASPPPRLSRMALDAMPCLFLSRQCARTDEYL